MLDLGGRHDIIPAELKDTCSLIFYFSVDFSAGATCTKKIPAIKSNWKIVFLALRFNVSFVQRMNEKRTYVNLVSVNFE